MDEDHVRMLGVNLVKTIPDQGVVVEVEAASECDLGPDWQQDLGLGSELGCDEIPGVDHCRSERAVVDKRTRSRAPWRTDVDFVLLDGLTAEEVQAVAAFDQCDAFGRQALEFDRS